MLSSGREETSRLPAAGCLSSHPGLKSAFSFGRAGPVARRSPPFHRPGKPRGDGRGCCPSLQGAGCAADAPIRSCRSGGSIRGGRGAPQLPGWRRRPVPGPGSASSAPAPPRSRRPAGAPSPPTGTAFCPSGSSRACLMPREVNLSAVERALRGFPRRQRRGPGILLGRLRGRRCPTHG